MILKINPMPKPRITWQGRNKPALKKYYNYCNALRILVARKKEQINWVHVYIVFFIKMPKSWSKKKKAQMVDQPHMQRPDIDNLTKAVLDALLPEDGHIWHIDVSKLWARTEGFISIETT